MTTLPVYPACPIKRDRATKLEMQARLEGLWSIVEAMRPMTVRQVFYQATVRDIVEKTDKDSKVPGHPQASTSIESIEPEH